MKKRINTQAVLLMLCLIAVCLHSLYLLVSWQIEYFLMCGVFACYLLFAVANSRNNRESNEA